MSLGPANDRSSAVKQEIRAAEIANIGDARSMTWDEGEGWDAFEDDVADPVYESPFQLLSGYLAAAITNHDDEIEDDA